MRKPERQRMAEILEIPETEVNDVILGYALYSEYGVDFLKKPRGQVRTLLFMAKAVLSMSLRFRVKPGTETEKLRAFARIWRETR